MSRLNENRKSGRTLNAVRIDDAQIRLNLDTIVKSTIE